MKIVGLIGFAIKYGPILARAEPIIDDMIEALKPVLAKHKDDPVIAEIAAIFAQGKHQQPLTPEQELKVNDIIVDFQEPQGRRHG